MPVEANEFVIVGVTRDGRQFRPSDWAERLCGVTSRLDVSNRMQYSPYVQPAMADGMKCVVVDVRLKETEPLAYRFLENSARDNELVVRAGRRSPRAPAPEAIPAGAAP